MSKKFICFDLSQLPHCCGALEAGSLTICSDGAFHHRQYVVSVKGAVEKIKNERPVFINFVQNCLYNDNFEEEYECQELLDEFLGHPDVIDLGTWINPNSDNRIHGFMIKGTAHED